MKEKINTIIDLSKATEVVLGLGETIVGHSIDYKGSLALTFSLAPVAMKPGDPYIPDGMYKMGEGSVVLVFKTYESVMSHLERINMMVQDYEEALNK